MNFDTQITITLSILGLAIILFVTEWLRVDLVALLVLGGLALTGMVTPSEALSGFSNPAVITVWAVFILSGGLSKTGVANIVGRQVLRLAGEGEIRLIFVIMLAAGVMSAFMNNVGVVALLLPVTMDIARRTGRAPSRLLMPLAFGSLLGGMTTLISTPANILASDALTDFNLPPFQLFDFAPVGVVVLFVGIVYMALIGRRLLPERNIAQESSTFGGQELEDFYEMREDLFVIRLPEASILSGKTLAESRVGSALGLNVLGIIRDGHTQLSPGPYDIVLSGDRLLVSGRLDRLNEMGHDQQLIIEEDTLAVENLISTGIDIVEVTVTSQSPFLGQSLEQINFRRQYGINVLAIGREGVLHRTGLQGLPLRENDTLLVQAPRQRILALQESLHFTISSPSTPDDYRLTDVLGLIRVPASSALIDKTLAESRLGEAYGLTVLGIIRDGVTRMIPKPTEQLEAGDKLLVEGKLEGVMTMHGLQDLQVEFETRPSLSQFESEQIGLEEAVLSHHTTLAGKTLRQLHFREKYGLNVLAIHRGGRAYRANLQEMALRFGDALLLYGPRERLLMLGSEPDFLVLAEAIQEPPRIRRAPLSVLIMVGVILSVLVGWLPISIAAVVGGALMILFGCLTMDEAYRFIEWRAVFLIAGMLPLGIAMENSGAARWIAEGVVSAVGGFGPLALIAGLFVLTTLGSQFMPNPVVTVLMAPIAITTATNLDLSPFAFMMVVAIAASSSFLSPVGHPSNVLIMGPGGYRFTDYIKVGLPLTVVVMAVVLLILPIFWPLV
jgi:di/tricarboxylate transporter